MEISDELLCLFSADVHEETDRYVVEIPRREIDNGTIEAGETYRVALITRGAGEPKGGTSESSTASTGSSDEPQPPARCATSR